MVKYTIVHRRLLDRKKKTLYLQSLEKRHFLVVKETAFNRTIEELKFLAAPQYSRAPVSFNRTIEELKYANPESVVIFNPSFNRTIEELK